MAQNLTDEEKSFFEDILKKYEPYPEDSLEATCFDYPCSPMRRMATTAKKVLEGKVQLRAEK